MRRFAILLAVFIAAPTLRAASAPDEGEEAKGPSRVEEMAAAARFEVVPESLRIDHHLRYDADGAIERKRYEAHLELKVRCDDELNPVAYRDLKLTRIVTDEGRELTPKGETASGSISGGERRGRNGQPQFDVRLELPRLPRTAVKLARIEGQMVVEHGEGPKKRAVLAPVGKIEGKPLRIEGLGEELPLTVRRENRDHGHDRVRITYPEKFHRLLADVKLTDAAGNELSSRGHGRGRSGGEAYQYFYTQMPDNGRIELRFYRRIKSLDVPFTVKGLRLPAEPEDGAEPITIRALAPEKRPRDEGAEGEAARAEAAPRLPERPVGELGDLDVQIRE